MKCVCDFETFSELNLADVGATVYAQHPSTEILCMSYRTPDMPKAAVWVPGREPFPQKVIDHILAGGYIEAHNAGFERAIWRWVLMVLCPEVPWPKKWKDTMAVCAYRGLPLGLDEVGEAIKLTVRKDTRGAFLISKLCKPQKATKKNPETRCRDPQLLEELYSYCGQDSDSEWELGERIGDLPDDEYHIWILDQYINDRGVYVDIEAVDAALDVVNTLTTKLNKELSEITGGKVTKGTQGARITDWLEAQGVNLPDCTALTVERALEDPDLAPECKRVLEIRQTLAHASVKKLKKFKIQRAKDGRAHETLQYHGASTGRWAGRGIQLHNIIRGDEVLQSMATGRQDEAGIEELIAAIKTRDLDYLDIVYGNPIDAVTSSLKGMITAAPGSMLHVRDFSAIESVLTAWISEEQWKLDAFASIFKGEKYKGADDIYCATAAFIFGHPVSKKKQPEERQDGKRCELAFGFQGGVGAWRRFDPRRPCDEGYKSDDEVNDFKNRWRAIHPNVQGAWFTLESMAIDTVLTGKPHYFTKVYFDIVNDNVGKWLVLVLPTGRKLWYLNPRVEIYQERNKRTGKMQEKRELWFMGKNSKAGGAWMEIPIYGGMWMENCLVEGTLVFTHRGPVAIEHVLKTDFLWDGEFWVSHGGLLNKGIQSVQTFGGLIGTPDHKVLHHEGWKQINQGCYENAVSICENFGRNAAWVSCGHAVSWFESLPIQCLGNAMRLRKHKGSNTTRFYERGCSFLWMQNQRIKESCRSSERDKTDNSRIIEAQTLSRMAFHEGSLSVADTAIMEELRRSGHKGMQAVDAIREFLEGYVSYLEARTTIGTEKQQSGLHSEKLHLGNPTRTSLEPEIKQVDRDIGRTNDPLTSGPLVWSEALDHAVSPSPPLAERTARKPVYDLLNAGSRHRYTVIDSWGNELIASNCAQSIARDCLVAAMIRCERAKYPLILTIHDELVCETKKDFGSPEEFDRLILEVPPWLKGCPIGAAGWDGVRYHKD